MFFINFKFVILKYVFVYQRGEGRKVGGVSSFGFWDECFFDFILFRVYFVLWLEVGELVFFKFSRVEDIWQEQLCLLVLLFLVCFGDFWLEYKKGQLRFGSGCFLFSVSVCFLFLQYTLYNLYFVSSCQVMLFFFGFVVKQEKVFLGNVGMGLEGVLNLGFYRENDIRFIFSFS